jgi:PAS domain S-box-containing protein
MTKLILVVDDDDLIRFQLRELMEEVGYQVVEASHGQQALAIYTRQNPDMILLDAMMPVMDGFNCCQQLQTLPGGASTPVLMITALYDQASVERAFAVGATDYITKPIQWSVLSQRVCRMLEASQTLKTLQEQTEQAQTREAQLRMALEAARMGAWDWDILNNKITWSKNLGDLLGLKKGFNPSYETFLQCVHPEDRNFVSQSVMESLQKEPAECNEPAEYNIDIEYRILLPDGNIRWMANKGVVFRNTSGIAVRMSGIDMDITKRKEVEETLEVQAKQQAIVAELSQLALSGLDLTTLFSEAVTLVAQCLQVEYCKLLELLPDGNTFLLRAGVGWHEGLVGYATVGVEMDSQAGYTLNSTEPVVVDDLAKETRFTDLHLLHDHQVVSGASVIIHGRERPFGVLGAHTTKQRSFNRDDIYFLRSVANVLATAIERQLVEDALRESELRWQLAVRGNNDGIWDWNLKTNQIFFSTRWKQILGYEDGEISNTINEWTNRVHPDDIAWVTELIQDHFAKKTPFYISEHRILCKDGTYKWILDRGQALWDKKDNVVRMSGSYTDITERKLAEEKLRQSEERFQILARATNDAVWDWNLQTSEVWWNESVQTLFGYSRQKARGNRNWWRDRLHPHDRQRIVADLETAIASGEQFWSNEYRFLRSDCSYADIFDRGYVVHDSTGKPVRMIGAMMDISERKRSQQELARQNMRSQLFADITLKIRESLHIEEILQTSVTEVQKLLNADRVLIYRLWPDGSGTVVQEAVVPGLRVALKERIFDRCFSENYIQQYREGRIRAMDDIHQANIEPCHVQFLESFGVKSNLAVPIIFQNQLWGLLIAHQCAHTRQWTQWEIELLRQLGDQIGIALAQSQILEQETRQRQELSRSNEELQQFAMIASHDLQEPLRKIKTFGDRLKATCEDALTPKGRDYLMRMQNAAQRMQALIEDLLALSRVTTRAQPFVPVNLFQITQEVLSDLEIRIQQTSATISVEELPTINADPLQIRQLLQNLIGNALKFHRPEVPPVVRIYSQDLNNESDLMVNVKKCQIVVQDNGIGFDEKYLDRIFNVFQRLHGRSEYEGTGIGLAICRKIAERHHGTITAAAQPGNGAKFIVTLPRGSTL